jgi:hypothetical protein
MWVGLDEFMHDSKFLGVIMLVFSFLQLVNVINKLVNPTGLRSIRKMQSLTAFAIAIEAPLMVLIILYGDSAMKWISVVMSAGAIFAMLVVTFVVTQAMKMKQKKQDIVPESPATSAIEIPLALVNGKPKEKPEVEEIQHEPFIWDTATPEKGGKVMSEASTGKSFKFWGDTDPSFHSSFSTELDNSAITADTEGWDDMTCPVRLHVVSWEPGHIDIKNPFTPRKDTTYLTPRTPRQRTPRDGESAAGILTLSAHLPEAVRGTEPNGMTPFGISVPRGLETPRKEAVQFGSTPRDATPRDRTPRAQDTI